MLYWTKRTAGAEKGAAEMGMELEMELRQGLTLSPQMIQSAQILQMGTQELGEYLRELAQENPMVELSEPARPQADPRGEALYRRLQWLEDTDRQNRAYHAGEEDRNEDPRFSREAPGENLYTHVCRQLSAMRPQPPEAKDALRLAACLDRDGYLREKLDDLAGELGRPEARLRAGLRLLRRLDPPGIGAADLGDCLALQLERLGRRGVELDIVRRHLEDLARGRYRHIARALDVEEADVVRAHALIRTLDPRPGAPYAPEDPAGYLIPDVFVSNGPNGLEVALADGDLPQLHLSRGYQDMLRAAADGEVRNYLTGKLRQAQWVAHSITQRRETLLACAKCIAARQEGFFARGPSALRGLTMAQVAGELGVHESTVSRAVREKYLQCRHGVFPLSYFFSRELSASDSQEEGGVSAQAAQAMLRRLVEEEDPRRPLSDQKLCELLEEQGCRLSRRTVAKYRQILGIPGTAGRRTRT